MSAACAQSVSPVFPQAKTIVPVANYAVFGDLNGDRKADQVSPAFGTVNVLLQGQNMSVAYPVGPGCQSVGTLSLEDIYGNGKLDVIDKCGQVLDILLGNGDGTLLPYQEVTLPDTFTVYAFGDLNRDGHPDLVYFPSTGVHVGQLAVAISGGAVHYLSAFSMDPQNSGLVIGDFNGDGWPDIAALGGQLTYYLNNGNGSFAQPQYVGSVQGHGLAAADVDGDGIDDMVATVPYGVAVIPGNKSGKLTVTSTYHLNGAYASLQLIDLNGDGAPDLVTSAGVMLNDKHGNFSAPVSYLGEGTVVDYNGDGALDMLSSYSSSTEYVTYNNGNGTFNAPELSPLGPDAPGTALANQTALADFNGDGKTDILVETVPPGSVTPFLSIELNNGDGTFTAYPGPAALAGSVVAGDINHDGKADVVYATFPVDFETGTVSVAAQSCINQGSVPVAFSCGAMKDVVALGASTPANSAFYLADMDGDGISDLVSIVETDFESDYYMYISHGNGDGTFLTGALAAQVGDDTVGPPPFFTADFNRDGRPDFVLGSGVYLRQADGTYLGAGVVGYPVAVADVNGDGYPDVVAEEAGSKLTFAFNLNNGAGAFPTSTTLATTYDAYSTYSYPLAPAAAGDLNGDGHPDLVFSPLYGFNLVVAYNDGLGNFTLDPNQYLLPNNPSSYTLLDLNALAHDSSHSARYDLLAICNSGPAVPLLNQTNPISARRTLPLVKLTLSANPVTSDGTVTLTASVVSTHPKTAPTGTVYFYNDGLLLASAPLINGSASVTGSTSGIPQGSYRLTALYGGSPAYQGAGSNTQFLAIEQKAVPTNVYLVLPAEPETADGLTVTNGTPFALQGFAVPVAGQGEPGGTVTFSIGPAGGPYTPFATAPVIEGIATLSTDVPGNPPPGLLYINASYSGSSGFAPSTALQASRVTIMPQTQTTITSPSSETVTVGEEVLFTVTFTASDDMGYPSRNGLSFYLNGKYLAYNSDSATYGNGVQTITGNFTVPSLAAGKYALTAQFLGYPYVSSTSPAVTLTVQ